MLKKNDVIILLRELDFDAREYWVTSGAAMVLYGIREATRDLDLGCNSQMADRLEEAGYKVEILKDGSRRIKYSDSVEIFENWLEDKVVLYEGIPVVSIDGLIRMKEKLGREKDIEDILLIKKVKERLL